MRARSWHSIPMARALLMGFQNSNSRPKNISTKVPEVITGGINIGAQVLLCMVLKAPAQTPIDLSTNYKPSDARMKVVLKVFDSISFPDPEDWCQLGLPKDTRADSYPSREANAYQRLYKKGIILPQLHGHWAMNFNVGDSPEVYWRCAGTVFIEYIEGSCIESLCNRDET
ncbi:hypothetical protein CT0861_00857 [Colletotrichum tofieldiae]|uniref:Uncharacterized protein n=1 Tax=Colletotrichum tofieldiae TaxID=708197 RepID=A0A166XCT0_9PEZI|nr:hypothetical protein CT0861_00857 [Colletotrichum tofieldiae]